MITAVKVVASSASIIIHYTHVHVHVASQNTSEIDLSLGHEYTNCQLALYKVSTIRFYQYGSKLQVYITCEELL